MHTKTPRFGWNRIIIGLVAAGAICSLALWTAREREAELSPHDTKLTAVDSTSAATAPAVAELKTTVPVSREITQPERAPQSPPVPEKIARVFTSIEERVEDWRKFRPESLTVAAYPDLPVTFTQIAIKDEGRYVTWIGRDKSMPGSSFVGVATENGYDAILVIPGASQFSFHVRGDEVVVTETAPGEESCAVGPVQAARSPVESGSTIAAVQYVDGIEPTFRSDPLGAAIKVDVLIAYDADTLANAATKSSDPVGYIDGQAKAMVETGNVVLNQSGVTTFEWRYLGSVAAPSYPRTGKLSDDIDVLQPGGALIEWIRTTRIRRGADQICLFVGGASDWGGVASSPKQKAITPDYVGSVVKWGNSYKILIHELAHNFGCKHDRANYEVDVKAGPNSPATAAPDGDGFWCYGQMWNDSGRPPSSPTTTGTIMSYAQGIIPYFSNPNITVKVTADLTGRSTSVDMGTHLIGRVETDSKAAYNARVLNEQALAMSAISEEITTPSITQHPAGGTVTRGTALSLTVTAAGGGLTYQWHKDGVAISGATSSSLFKAAADTDAGKYKVVVQNFAGTVTSSEATIGVVAPQAPVVTTPTPSSGSGGGGGAPSTWFYGLIGAAWLTRFLFRRNKIIR